jgi:hypothetical protein
LLPEHAQYNTRPGNNDRCTRQAEPLNYQALRWLLTAALLNESEACWMEVDHYENFPVARALMSKARGALVGWLAVSVEGNA